MGVDPSAEMTDGRGADAGGEDRLRFVQAPAEELPLLGGHFDLVLSTLSFHHWADQRIGLREVGRVLAPRGVSCWPITL